MIRDFTRQDAKGALQHFKQNGVKGGHDKGLKRRHWGVMRKEIAADEALERLDNGDTVQIPDREDGYYKIQTQKELQVLDDLLGRQEGFALTADQANALTNLESGPNEKDGLYDPGFIYDSRKDAFTAAQELLEGKEINVRLGDDKENLVHSFDDLQELDAFQGTGTNTILPDAEFKAMTHYEGEMGFQIAGAEDQKAYDALNTMQAGSSVGIESNGRTASVASPTDAAELHALEGGAPSADPTIEKLQYFEQASGENAFLVGGGQTPAYESLQEIQAGKSVGVEAGGVHNSVSSAKDLSDLDDLLGRKQNQLLPDEQMSSLDVLTQGIDEGEGLYLGSDSLNRYGGYKAIENTEKTPEYRFQGGDANEQISVPVSEFGSLSDVQQRVENQKEFDRYALSEPEMRESYSEATDGIKGAFEGQFSAEVGKLQAGVSKMTEASESGLELTSTVADLPADVSILANGLQELSHGYSLGNAVQAVRATESELTTAKRSRESFQESSNTVDRRANLVEKEMSSVMSSVFDATRVEPGKPTDPRRERFSSSYKRVKDDLSAFKDSLSELTNLRSLSHSVFNDLGTALRGAKNGLNLAQSKSPEMSNEVNEIQADLRHVSGDAVAWSDDLTTASRAMDDTSIELTGLTSESDTSLAKNAAVRSEESIQSSQDSGRVVLESLRNAPKKTGEINETLSNIENGLGQWPKKRNQVEKKRANLEAEVRVAKRAPERIKRDLQRLITSVTDLSNEALSIDSGLTHKAGQLIQSVMGFEGEIGLMKADMEMLADDTQKLFSGLNQVDSSIRRVRETVSNLSESGKLLEADSKSALDKAENTARLESSAKSAATDGAAYLETVPATQQAVNQVTGELMDVNPASLSGRQVAATMLGENSSGELKEAALNTEQLLQTQLARPPRPQGWVEPGPRVA